MSNSDLPLSPFIESWKTVNKYNGNMNNSELFDNLLFNLHHADNIHDGMTSEAFKGGLPPSFESKIYYKNIPFTEDKILKSFFGEIPSDNDIDTSNDDFWKNQINVEDDTRNETPPKLPKHGVNVLKEKYIYTTMDRKYAENENVNIVSETLKNLGIEYNTNIYLVIDVQIGLIEMITKEKDIEKSMNWIGILSRALYKDPYKSPMPKNNGDDFFLKKKKVGNNDPSDDINDPTYYNYNKKFNSKQQLQYKNKLQPAIEDTSDPPIDNPPYLERRMNLSDSLLSKFHLKTCYKNPQKILTKNMDPKNIIVNLLIIDVEKRTIRFMDAKLCEKKSAFTGLSKAWRAFQSFLINGHIEFPGDSTGTTLALGKRAGDQHQVLYAIKPNKKIHLLDYHKKNKIFKDEWKWKTAEDVDGITFFVTHDRLAKTFALMLGANVMFYRPENNNVDDDKSGFYEVWLNKDELTITNEMIEKIKNKIENISKNSVTLLEKYDEQKEEKEKIKTEIIKLIKGNIKMINKNNEALQKKITNENNNITNKNNITLFNKIKAKEYDNLYKNILIDFNKIFLYLKLIENDNKNIDNNVLNTSVTAATAAVTAAVVDPTNDDAAAAAKTASDNAKKKYNELMGKLKELQNIQKIINDLEANNKKTQAGIAAINKINIDKGQISYVNIFEFNLKSKDVSKIHNNQITIHEKICFSYLEKITEIIDINPLDFNINPLDFNNEFNKIINNINSAIAKFIVVLKDAEIMINLISNNIFTSNIQGIRRLPVKSYKYYVDLLIKEILKKLREYDTNTYFGGMPTKTQTLTVNPSQHWKNEIHAKPKIAPNQKRLIFSNWSENNIYEKMFNYKELFVKESIKILIIISKNYDDYNEKLNEILKGQINNEDLKGQIDNEDLKGQFDRSYNTIKNLYDMNLYEKVKSPNEEFYFDYYPNEINNYMYRFLDGEDKPEDDVEEEEEEEEEQEQEQEQEEEEQEDGEEEEDEDEEEQEEKDEEQEEENEVKNNKRKRDEYEMKGGGIPDDTIYAKIYNELLKKKQKILLELEIKNINHSDVNETTNGETKKTNGETIKKYKDLYLKYINKRLLITINKKKEIIFWRDIFSVEEDYIVEEDSENIEEEDSEYNNGEVKKDWKTEDKNELNNELNNYNNLALVPPHLKYEKGPYVSCEYNTISNIISKSFGVIKDITTILYHWYGNTEIYIIHHKQSEEKAEEENSFKNIIFINNGIRDEELKMVTENLEKRNIVLESLDNWIKKKSSILSVLEGNEGNEFIKKDVTNLFKIRKDINKYFYECGCVLESISTNANNNGGYKRRKKLKRRKKTKKKDKKRKNKKRKQKKTKHKKKRKRKTKRV